jgi:hypothetical protein
MLPDFDEANPEFGDDQFAEVIGRMQLMFNYGPRLTC